MENKPLKDVREASNERESNSSIVSKRISESSVDHFTEISEETLGSRKKVLPPLSPQPKIEPNKFA